MLLTQFNNVLPVVFGFAAVLYLWLAVRVSRATLPNSNNAISYFLFLIGAMIAGSAFAFGTEDPNIYGIGRTLSFFSGGFLPLVFYCIYREYTVGRNNPLLIAVLSIIPIITTLLAITNPMHNMIWTVVEYGFRDPFYRGCRTPLVQTCACSVRLWIAWLFGAGDGQPTVEHCARAPPQDHSSARLRGIAVRGQCG